MNPDPVLVLFAKKPVAGKVKTRLSPPLTADHAKQVAILLIEQSVKNACNHWPGKVELCLWPDFDGQFIQGLTYQYQFNLTRQAEGNLGDKMYVAMAAKKAVNQVALIMGCDVPHCTEEIFLTAFENLKNGHNVIGPTVDGGYYCIGVHRPQANMFNNVEWGTQQALSQTLESCKNTAIEFNSNLPILRDLDDYDDLVVLSKQCSFLSPFLI